MIMNTKIGDIVATERGIGYVIASPEFGHYVVKTRNGIINAQGRDITIRDKDELIEIIKAIIDEEPQF